MDITFDHGYNSWKFHDDTMKNAWQYSQHTEQICLVVCVIAHCDWYHSPQGCWKGKLSGCGPEGYWKRPALLGKPLVLCLVWVEAVQQSSHFSCEKLVVVAAQLSFWGTCFLVWLGTRFLVIMATNRNGQNLSGHKPKRPQTETATNWNSHKQERPQTETATNRNGHKPKRPQT